VSNPPYIDPAAALPKDLSFEPPLALFAADGGRARVHQIVAQAMVHLNEGGVMIMEIGESMESFVKQAGAAAGFNVSVMNDYGGLPRVAVFKTEDTTPPRAEKF
jgi:ribosomal protein L3 glutamine methyltransferase